MISLYRCCDVRHQVQATLIASDTQTLLTLGVSSCTEMQTGRVQIDRSCILLMKNTSHHARLLVGVQKVSVVVCFTGTPNILHTRAAT